MADSASNSQHSTRLEVTYQYASLALVVIGLGWAGVFSWLGWWNVVAVDALLIVIGLTSYLLIRSGQLNYGLLLSQAALILIAIVLSLVIDVPSADAPRVSHLYLLVIATLGYLNYRRQASRIQLALIAACLLAFIALASSPLTHAYIMPLPDSVRMVADGSTRSRPW